MNMIDRKRPAPPRPSARKANPVNAVYEDRAKELLRRAIAEQGLTIEELTDRLAHIGVEMSRGGVANKISRGGFSAAFLLQCFDALGFELQTVPKSGMQKLASRARP